MNKFIFILATVNLLFSGSSLSAQQEVDRLKSFLVNPVDSLISPVPVSFVCMEPDALSSEFMEYLEEICGEVK
ncbi:MAG: hypothetical protein LBP64_04780 [Tannerella sp.]|nr:hypothetical protein [Tannerella sp.]